MDHFFQTITGWFDFQDVYTFMVQRAPQQAHFVEVGAFLGKSTSFMAVEICNSGKAITFDVVDTWQGSAEHMAGGEHEAKVVLQGTVYENFKSNIKPVEHLINPIQSASLDAVRRYEDGSLDFVFLDASHEYKDIKADILAWRPKVKPGGFIGGHDYQGLFPGVIRAVREEFTKFSVAGFTWLTRIDDGKRR